MMVDPREAAQDERDLALLQHIPENCVEINEILQKMLQQRKCMDRKVSCLDNGSNAEDGNKYREE